MIAGTMGDQTSGLVAALAELPIEVAEAMYSPDFVELATLAAGGLPLVLPMSFTLDVPGNCVRLSSPLAAARLRHLARDPRCAVSFSRVTTGHPPVLLQGIAALGEVAEGMRRGPARRFTVAPVRVMVLDTPPLDWRFPGLASPAESGGEPATKPAVGARVGPPPAPVTETDLDAVTRFDTTAAALRDADGWPLSLPVELERDGTKLAARLPDLGGRGVVPGPASVVGHTWTKDGPRYLSLSGTAELDGDRLHFTPNRALRRA